MFSPYEILLLIVLCAGVIGIPAAAYFNKDYREIFSPINFVCIIFIYYAVIGPIRDILKDETVLRLIDHREYYKDAWFASIVSFYSLALGFLIKSKLNQPGKLLIKKEIRIDKLKKASIWTFGIAIFLFSIFTGFNLVERINFLDVSSSGVSSDSSFSAYLMHSINMFVIAVCLALTYSIHRRKYLVFIILFLLSISIFINEAFRWRLVTLIVATGVVYYLNKEKKPNILLIAGILIPFLLLMGIMEKGRQYGRGIDVNKVENLSNTDLLENSLNESAVFKASGYFMANCDDLYERTNFDFLINAIAAPIPRAIWPGKPDGSYMLQTNYLYGDLGKGQAFMFFCEYYISFGWIGIIVFSFLLGYWSKVFWLWYKLNSSNLFAIIGIALYDGFIYVVISRGYFSQQLTLFVFTVVPIFVFISLLKKRLI